MPHTIYNTDKNRKATLNEIAKDLIIDKLGVLQEFLSEAWGCETMTDEEITEVYRHLDKHIESIRKRLNPNNTNLVRR